MTTILVEHGVAGGQISNHESCVCALDEAHPTLRTESFQSELRSEVGNEPEAEKGSECEPAQKIGLKPWPPLWVGRSIELLPKATLTIGSTLMSGGLISGNSSLALAGAGIALSSALLNKEFFRFVKRRFEAMLGS